MGGDPWVSLETNKHGANQLSWKVDYKQYVGAPLALILECSLCLFVIDAVPGTGNEITVQMARVTLDHQQRVVGITCSSLECKAEKK